MPAAVNLVATKSYVFSPVISIFTIFKKRLLFGGVMPTIQILFPRFNTCVTGKGVPELIFDPVNCVPVATEKPPHVHDVPELSCVPSTFPQAAADTAGIFPMHSNKRTVAVHNQVVVAFVAGRALQFFLLMLQNVQP